MDFHPTATPLRLATGTIHRHASFDYSFQPFLDHA